MTRDEHLAFAKQRALEYVDGGDLNNAVTSMLSDLVKHPDLGCNSFLAQLGMRRAVGGDIAGVREWIEGFN